ncbi:hypothetical protein SAMN06893096_10422 [Geodermatophilus pulveris]|uniref:DUF222 domain-containing protein n=1 Tax=Geodermatophilus pulveris TaxID=1564159 RepID=A0A239ECE1_9ACTN|nr:hypothetical protein [Geodermatophilus pulveris]SNS41614.1 hypothetical protein SAMN06893096_10422 [Geodermatophilus pulveris]
MGRRQRVTTPAQLSAKARVVVARRDAAAHARRLATALRGRGVFLRPERAAGMAALTVVCTMPEARALHAALLACADALADDPDGPPRTRGGTAVDALLDLVLRPGETDLPPVRVLLTVVASVATLLGGDAPGEVDGEPVPAEMVRRLARAFAGLDPVAADPDSAHPPGADTPGADTPSSDTAGAGTAGPDTPSADIPSVGTDSVGTDSADTGDSPDAPVVGGPGRWSDRPGGGPAGCRGLRPVAGRAGPRGVRRRADRR